MPRDFREGTLILTFSLREKELLRARCRYHFKRLILQAVARLQKFPLPEGEGLGEGHALTSGNYCANRQIARRREWLFA